MGNFGGCLGMFCGHIDTHSVHKCTYTYYARIHHIITCYTNTLFLININRPT